MQKRFLPLLLVVVLLVCMLAVPASASDIADNTSSPSAVSLGTPERTYNDDNTVAVTYDLLDPYYKLFSVTGDDNQTFDQIGAGSKLAFTQTVTPSYEVITSATLLSVSGLNFISNTDENGATFYFSFKSFPDDFDYTALTLVEATQRLRHGTTDYTLSPQYVYSADGVLKYVGLGNPRLGDLSAIYDENGNELEDNGLSFFVFNTPTSTALTYYVTSKVGASFGFFTDVVEVVPASGEYDRVNMDFYPMGYQSTNMPMLDLSKIKSGSGYTLTFDYSWTASTDGGMSDMYGHIIFCSATGAVVDDIYYDFGKAGSDVADTVSVTVPVGARYVYMRWVSTTYSASPPSYWNFSLDSFTVSATLTASENSDLIQSESNSEIAGKLDIIGGKLDDVVDGLYEVYDGVNDVSGKLDDVNDNLDEMQNTMESLPGEIGDQIQGIIDSENEKAESAGNDYAGEIIEIVPDYSAAFIDALGTLVSVLNYDGTQCVLTTPPVVMPAIDGMFPETVLMESQEIDFEYYFNLMPTQLINLVRALFDVALVGYCFKELIDFLAQCFNGIPKN